MEPSNGKYVRPYFEISARMLKIINIKEQKLFKNKSMKTARKVQERPRNLVGLLYDPVLKNIS